MIEDPVPGLLEWREELRYWRGSLTLASGQAAAHLIVAWPRAEIIPGSRISIFLTLQSCMPSIRRREFRFGMSFPTSRGASGSSAS